MIKGSIVALITPMNEEGSVDYAGLEKLIQFHLDEQTDGLLVLGTTGESSTLTQSEEEKILQLTVKKVAGRVPVIAGAGTNNTKETIEKAKHFASLGADALLVITPYYNKTSDAGLAAHFTAIAEASPIPLILYNVPSRTGMSIPIHVLVDLAEHPNIIGLKEASGDMAYVMDAAARLISEKFSLYSGNDDLILPVMSVGGSGVISVWANIQPKIVHELVKDMMDGRWQQAKEKQLNALELIHALFSETNPIPVKAAMSLLNLPSGPLRLPLVSLSEEKKKQLAQLLLRERTVEK
nr:4-hydroxy-tetrahydrodipicolinate synthase [Enterococcus lactis]